MKVILSIIFLFTVLAPLQAQKEAAIWYFGNNAGLDFNSGAPVALTDGELRTGEGCATISDFNGNLLFYSDGVTVWNRNHNPMPNGTGLNGHASSTQSAIIIPAPNDLDSYYVFTVDEATKSKGLQYSIVNMNLDGGLGDITSKNIMLEAPVTEKLTAVTHANGTDIWVMALRFNSNEYVGYLVTAAGVAATPVVSAIGPPSNQQGHVSGYLKFSPDGTTLAAVASQGNYMHLFRFDTATGTLSNFLDISPFYAALAGTRISQVYGVEFSSDSSKLYGASTIVLNFPSLNYNLYQFDISNFNAAAITASATQLASQSTDLSALQLAIDGKIYVSQYEQGYLGVINNPNVLGTGAGYVQNGVSLAGRKAMLGLPPFIQSYFVVGLTATNFCLGDNTTFSVTTNEPITSILWNFGDGNTSTLENPSNIYATPGTYTVSVTANTLSDTKTETKEITIYNTPIANTTTDFEVCTSSANHEFRLLDKNSEVLGLQAATDFQIEYYPSLIDAQNATNILPDLYTNTNDIETIFARIQNVDNPSCFDTTSFDVVVQKSPIVNMQDDWTACDTDLDGFHSFNLSQKTTTILTGNEISAFTVSYYVSQLDLDNKTNPVPINYTNTIPRTEIFFRIENNTESTCYGEGTFFLEVISGVTANMPTDFEVCDDDNDGVSVFDFSSTKDAEVLGTQNAASITISYHISLLDAENGSNSQNKNEFTNTTPYNQPIFVRVENNADASCYDTSSFELKISDAPAAQAVANWEVCDVDNDGISSFDLSQKDAEILGSQPASQFSVSYYLDEADAVIGQNEIFGNFENTSNPQIIFYRLAGNSNSDCYISDHFSLEVFDSPNAVTASPIVICDTDETGSYTFEFSGKDLEILNGQDASDYSVSYFANETDAINNENLLSKTRYTNSALNEVIYARVHATIFEACYAISNFEISILELPQPNLDDETYVICPDSPELIIDAGDFESWIWLNSENIEIGTDQTIAITALGEYTLTVTQTQNGITCENTALFEVVSSGAPDDFTTEIKNFSDQVTIEIDVSGTGDFEYSIDGENFQESNLLVVFPGTYTVSVRDKFLCRTLTKEVIAVGYLKFFTPNNDATHDHWNVIGAENFPEAEIFIFDRYGKLLKQLTSDSIGWDGTFNGEDMPSSDYWFRFTNQGGNTFTGHFTLKR